jgi:uncharacterized cupin superfamily protein
MALIRIPHDTPANEAIATAAEKIIAGDPKQGAINVYSDPGGRFHAGIWEAEPATWRVSYSEHEYCLMLEGRILIREDSGTETLVVAGDSFVIPAGFSGTWQVLEKARKVYVIYEPAVIG